MLGKKETAAAKNSGVALKVRKFIYLLLAVFLLLAILSYRPLDADILSGGVDDVLGNWLGRCGAIVSWGLFSCFGLAAYLVPLFLLLRALRGFYPEPGPAGKFYTALLLSLLGAMLLFGLSPQHFVSLTQALGLGHAQAPELALSGGAFGQLLAAPQVSETHLPPGLLRQLIGAVGTTITGYVLLFSGLLLAYVSDWHRLITDGGLAVRPTEKPVLGAADPTVAPEPEKTADGKGKFSLKALFGKRAPDPEKPAAKAILGAEVASSPAGKAAVMLSGADDRPTATARLDDPVRPPERVPATPAPAGQLEVTEVSRGDKLRAGASEYVLPIPSMLARGNDTVGENFDEIERNRGILQQTLDSFAIPGQVTGYVTGPRVTRFEITLESGVNVKKVEQIQDNIAMNLAAERVRVLAPIPGRPVVGVEVSNRHPEAVFMRSVMESDAWRNTKAEIPLAVGKDVSGNPVVFDLGKAPHLLIAGTTGTGKSVCTNSLIISMLFRFRPDELKLIMVDPKIVEFEDYKRLPHLLTPIINDYNQVPIALRWAVNEMEKRYRILAAAGVKKLAEFNARPVSDAPAHTEDGTEIPAKMPYIVVVIDELADLMMTEAKKDAENAVQRIAQKGRAAGIHLIVATQRPSTNVITGTIKGNLPSRFCFQVRSMVDSRVVIDNPGAEKLLGKGDMLLMTSTSMIIERVQGAFVKDEDIKAIVKFISDQAPQHFDDTVLRDEAAEAEEAGSRPFGEDDVFDDMDYAEIEPVLKKYLKPGDSEVFKEALKVVLLDRQASTSYFQRRLKIGYNRAAEVTDELERRGIIGPDSGSGKKREILIFDGLEINS